MLSGSKHKEVKTTIISLKWEEEEEKKKHTHTQKLPSKLLYFLPFLTKKNVARKNHH